MAVQVSSPYDGQRQFQGLHASSESPRIQRPASQASLHLAPAFSPSVSQIDQSQAMSPFPTAHQQPMRQFQSNLSLPSPHQQYMGHPASAPPGQSYLPVYDARGMQNGMRPVQSTVSHAHPMNSASDNTTSSRWSSSPHSPHVQGLDNGPPTASQPGYPMHQLHQSGFELSYQAHDHGPRHINPMLTIGGQSMSRSTSGASDAAGYDDRLVTPFEYRQYQTTVGGGALSPNEQDLRKVSDSLGRVTNRVYSQSFLPNFDMSGHSLSLQPHPQPDGMYYQRNGPYSTDFAVSSERHDIKPDIGGMVDTDYERERSAQIMQNKKTLESLGLGASHVRSRPQSAMGNGCHRNANTPAKKRLTSSNPVRASPRIASMSRNVSYAHLDGGEHTSDEDEAAEDEFNSDLEEVDEEEEFRPTKKARGHKQSYSKKSYTGYRSLNKPQLSLYGLLQVYPEIPNRFPLFYYTLNNDLTINPDSVPLIGSISSTVTPIEKAETLKSFFQRGKRVLSQLDAFTSRCDRKWDGPDPRWQELDFHTRVAIRDVRRKVVERCENYKYTRRDILDKIVGKNKWQPIESGYIEWRAGLTANDPAGDLANVTLTLPTPPPGVYMQHQQPRQMSSTGSHFPDRLIRPFPRSRMPSSAGPRTVSITMAEPDHQVSHQPYTAAPGLQFTGYTYHQQVGPNPPMYGDDEPMSVHLQGGMQSANGDTTATSNNTSGIVITPESANLASGDHNPPLWPGMQGFTRSPLPNIEEGQRGLKRSHSDDEDNSSDNDEGIHQGDNGNKGAELSFGGQRETQWNGGSYPVI